MSRSVIDNIKEAKSIFTAEYMYICNFVEERMDTEQHMTHAKRYWPRPTLSEASKDENERMQRCVRRLDSTNMNTTSTTGAIYYIYHRCHIDKVMVVAVTGYVFDGAVENGGDGLKLGMWRV
jgi:hypothetical protein